MRPASFTRALAVCCLISVLILYAFFAKTLQVNWIIREKGTASLTYESHGQSNSTGAPTTGNSSVARTPLTHDESHDLTAKNSRVAPVQNVDLKANQSLRLSRIRKVCKRYPVTGEVSELYAYAPRNVSYCSNHKVASTYWIQVLRFLHKDIPPGVRKPSDISKFHAHLSPFRQTRKRRFKSKIDYDETMRNYRFMVTRDPYQRLWSVYIDKYVLLDLYFWRQYSSSIRGILLRGYDDISDQWWRETNVQLEGVSSNFTDKNRRVPFGRSRAPCKQLSFEEFLVYVANVGKSNVKALNDHLQPIHVGCNPCVFKPDFVGSVKSLTSEKGFLLEKLGLQPDIDGVADFEDHVRYEIRTLSEFEFQLFSMSREACVTLANLQERIVTAFILNGYLPRDSLDALKPLLPILKDMFVDKIMELFKNSQRSPEAVHKQREEMRKQAFRRVPYQTLLSIQQIFKYDFLLFGYEPKPSYIYEDRIDFEISKMFDNR